MPLFFCERLVGKRELNLLSLGDFRRIGTCSALSSDSGFWMFSFDPFTQERHRTRQQALGELEKGLPPVYSRVVFPQPGMAQDNVVSADVGDKESSDFEMSIDFYSKIDFVVNTAKGVFCVIDVSYHDISRESFHWYTMPFDKVLVDKVGGGTTIHKCFGFNATVPPTSLEFNW